MTKVLIEFDPFRVTMPLGNLTGKVKIVLPELHLKLIDLSLGDLPDAYIGCDSRALTLMMDLGHSVLTSGEFLEILEKTEEQWLAIHKAAQVALGDKFLLGA